MIILNSNTLIYDIRIVISNIIWDIESSIGNVINYHKR